MNDSQKYFCCLSSAVTLALCASVSAEEDPRPNDDVIEKVQLMETINVTSSKEVTQENSTSDDPEVNKVLSLIDSLTSLEENSTDELAPTDDKEKIASTVVDTNIDSPSTETAETVANNNDSTALESEQSYSKRIKPKQVLKRKTDQTE